MGDQRVKAIMPPARSTGNRRVDADSALLPDTARWSEQGHLCIGGWDVTDLADRCGTPLYMCDRATLMAAARAYRAALRACYEGRASLSCASKAYLCGVLARLWADEGLGLDVVGSGELETALRARFAPERLHLHGNGKALAPLRRAAEAGLGRVVIDGTKPSIPSVMHPRHRA